MSHQAKRRGVVQRLQEFSIPLIAGVVCALLVANLAPDLYQRLVHDRLGGLIAGHHDLHDGQGDHADEENDPAHELASVTPVGLVPGDSGVSHDPHDSHGPSVASDHPEEPAHGHSPWALAFIVNDILWSSSLASPPRRLPSPACQEER